MQMIGINCDEMEMFGQECRVERGRVKRRSVDNWGRVWIVNVGGQNSTDKPCSVSRRGI